jgi:hypothetical protein
MLLEGLEIRATSWERTASYLRNPVFSGCESFLIEECSKPEEADSIAAHYRSIIETIRQQMKTQS